MLPIGTSTTRGWPEQLDVGGNFLRQPEGRHCTKGQWIMFCDALPVGNVAVFKFWPVNDNELNFLVDGTAYMKSLPVFSLIFSTLITTSVLADSKTAALTHARGTFTVTMAPLSPAPAEGLARYGMEKQLHGGIEGSSKGEMFSGGDPAQGAAGYVAIEVVTGTVNGKLGTFALQHLATMSSAGQKMTVVVVPGSGTGALKGISGTFTIKITGERHDYDLAYTLAGGK